MKKRNILAKRMVMFLVVGCMAAGAALYWWQSDNKAKLAEDTNHKVSSSPNLDENKKNDNKDDKNENVKNENNTVTVCSVGNIMFHDKQLEGAKTENGYDFRGSFDYVKNIISSADIGIGIFEGTTSGGTPTGFPYFDSPDSAMDAFKDTGIDILNLASNHIYDKSDEGMLRTVKTAEDKGLETLGVRDNTSDKKYIVKDVNGMKLGFVAYTFETMDKAGRRTINSNIISDQSIEHINTFDYDNVDGFYSDIKAQIDAMKTDGAEFIITSMHWGEEYETVENNHQSEIANKLNELGVDIILGGHPHVIQPYTTITSESGHKTFVIYSQGNFLSNQCEDEIGIPESEDGTIVNFTLEKADGAVSLKDVEIIPTWVYREQKEDGSYSHKIVPVNDAINNRDKYNLSDEAYEKVKSSLQRTTGILGNSLTIAAE